MLLLERLQRYQRHLWGTLFAAAREMKRLVSALQRWEVMGEGRKRGLVGGDVGGAAAVAGGGLGSLDVEVEQLHLSEGNSRWVRGRHRWLAVPLSNTSWTWSEV